VVTDSLPAFDTTMLRLALALGAGLLIGAERGWQTRDEAEGSRVAGERTFAVSGLLGGVVAALDTGSGMLLAAALCTFAVLIAAFELSRVRQTGNVSATNTVAAVLTFAIGSYAVKGDVRVAAAIAVMAAVILTARASLHAWLKRITSAEWQSTLLLLAMTCVALPIVPDRTLDWLPGINPREIWIMAIVIAAASYAGYVAARVFGERRGALMAAAAGAVVSSLAVIAASARRAARGEGRLTLLLAGCALASAISLTRVAVLVFVLAPEMMLVAAPALGTGAIVSLGISLLLARSDGTVGAQPQLRNPFGLASTLLLAASIALVVLLGTIVHARFGSAGALVSALVAGAFDVDSMTIAMAKLAQSGAPTTSVGLAVLAGTAANMTTKTIAGAVLGRGRFAVGLVLIGLAPVAAGALVLWLLS